MVLSDGPAGVRGQSWDERDSSANVPSATGLAATWDPGRIEAIGALLAREARRKGVDVLLAPTVNLHRTPYGGPGLRVLLRGSAADRADRRRLRAGPPAPRRRARCVKHFVGNDSETQRMTVDVRIDERTLREVYLAPFEAIFREAGAWAVMAAYNGVNGSTMTESPLLRDILHREWGYDGLVVSDWTAARSTEATAEAALDLAMPGPASRFGPWGDLWSRRSGTARSTRRSSTTRCSGSSASPPASAPWRTHRTRRAAAGARRAPGAPAPDSLAVAQELRAAAAAGFVLARNDGILPLSWSGPRLAGTRVPAGVRVAVIGPNAEVARTMGGGSATVFPPYTVSPLDGLRAAGLHVTHAAGVSSHLRARRPGRPGCCGRTGRAPGPAPRSGSSARSGELVGSELRDGATFLWMSGSRPAGGTEPVARLEIRCVIRATVAGTYRLGVSGLGRYRLLVDGAEVFDATLALPGGRRHRRGPDDPAAATGPARAGRGPGGRRGARARRDLLAVRGVRHVRAAQPRAAARHRRRGDRGGGRPRGRQRRRRGRGRHHRRGGERGLRPHVAGAAGPAGRTGPPGRGGQPADRGGGQLGGPGPAALGRRTWRRCCCPGSAARSSATRSPTCCSATPSPAGGCP